VAAAATSRRATFVPSMGKMMAKEKAGLLRCVVMVETGLSPKAPATTPTNRHGNKDHHPALSNEILHGHHPRRSPCRFAKEARMVVEERNFTIPRAQQAMRRFTTSAQRLFMPVVEIDGVGFR